MGKIHEFVLSPRWALNGVFVYTQVRTLFVSGLPMDVRPREIYLLFRTYNGYAGSSLKLMAKHGKIPQVCGNINETTL